MATIEITLPDGSQRAVPSGSTLKEIAAGIGARLAEAALAARVDDALVDMTAVLERSARVEFFTFESENGRDVFWHSGSHLLAQAVVRLFPEAKYTIGPAVDTGFYYDFDLAHSLGPDDLARIETEMAKIVAEDLPVVRRVLPRDEAIALFEKAGNPYKTEIIRELPEGETVSLYEQGEFVDLCRGPHVPSTGLLKAVKLTALSGAYWRGDQKNRMLQRVYGIAFPKKKALEEHLARIEEAKKRDHRKIGRELELFSFQDEGPGFPFWHPNGATLFQTMVGYIRDENRRRGYREVITPIILNESLWHKSGHWDNFRENMYFTDIDGQGYAVKPMNCPGGLLIYKDGLHSYRELPIRNAELGLVHRHELSGVLHGLFRARSFTQDDAHIFCTPEMIRDEVRGVIEYTLAVYRDFGFDEVTVFIATRPEKSIGSDEDWTLATDALVDALKQAGIAYRIKEGEGAFYGPKIEFNIKDCLGRNWQCGTCQVDFSMPTRFGATYRGSDGKDHHPVMLHRAIFGSLERFIGVVIEHCAGKFPFWLAPVQAIVLSISEAAVPYAREVAERLFGAGFRIEDDFSGESLGNKIRVARTRRIPYILVIGENEARDRTVSVKTYLDENASGLALEALEELWRRAERERSRGTLLADIQRG